jgi:hypothetical protein
MQLNTVMLIQLPCIVGNALKDLLLIVLTGIGLTGYRDKPWIAIGYKGHHAAGGHGDMAIDQIQNRIRQGRVIDTAYGIEQLADSAGVYRYCAVG